MNQTFLHTILGKSPAPNIAASGRIISRNGFYRKKKKVPDLPKPAPQVNVKRDFFPFHQKQDIENVLNLLSFLRSHLNLKRNADLGRYYDLPRSYFTHLRSGRIQIGPSMILSILSLNPEIKLSELRKILYPGK